ncbi:MAG TPA: hypothetical protein VJ085_09825 [Candidatus Acidoferrales bacterium]|nr:hypothetical protein [Candidatus Acidoferrales bacterium]
MRKVVLVLSALLLVSGLAWAQASTPPSLAEVARKVRAERAKKDLSEVPLYTNESIPREGAPVAVVGSAAPAAPAVAAGEEGAAAVAGKEAGAGEAGAAEECDEQCWRGKFRQQREKIRTAEQELDLLQREYNLSRTQYYQDPNQAMREQYSGNVAGGRQLQDLLNQMSDKRAEIQRLRQELSDLEDDLRRAGGKAGWARD